MKKVWEVIDKIKTLCKINIDRRILWTKEPFLN
jgi:hypothetical protein